MPKLQQKVNRSPVTTNSVSKAVTQNIENGNNLLLRINGKSLRGSGSTFIKTALAKQLKLPIRRVRKRQLSCLLAAEGSWLMIEGVTYINLNVSVLLIMHTVYVVTNIYESLILGSDSCQIMRLVVLESKKIYVCYVHVYFTVSTLNLRNCNFVLTAVEICTCGGKGLMRGLS
jgi:hypothetical protein